MSKIDVINPHKEFISVDCHLRKHLSLISATHLLQLLKQNQDFLIFDLRCSESYMRNHILQSKHLNCSTNMMTKKSIFQLKKELNPETKVHHTIILYNQSNTNYNDYLYDFVENNDFNVMFLDGGFEVFSKCAPCEFLESSMHAFINSPTNPEYIKDDIMGMKISEIEPHLYLGNAHDSGNLDLLLSIGITAILCVTSNTKLHFEHLNKFSYKRIEASDSCNQNLAKYFDETYEFIETVRQNNGKVLVHCMAGVSRSVSIVLAYLIKKYKINVLQALDSVIKKRSIAAPNLNFLGQLDRYHRELDG